MMSEMSEIFGKVTSAKLKSNFSGHAGGSALERASPPKAGERFREKLFVEFLINGRKETKCFRKARRKNRQERNMIPLRT